MEPTMLCRYPVSACHGTNQQSETLRSGPWRCVNCKTVITTTKNGRLPAGFRATTAVAMSNVTIVGGTLANFAFNVGRRHPQGPGPLIDWDLILVMEPSTILGALAGGYINHVSGIGVHVLYVFVCVDWRSRTTARAYVGIP
jgi:hypothetical protein